MFIALLLVTTVRAASPPALKRPSSTSESSPSVGEWITALDDAQMGEWTLVRITDVREGRVFGEPIDFRSELDVTDWRTRRLSPRRQRQRNARMHHAIARAELAADDLTHRGGVAEPFAFDPRRVRIFEAAEPHADDDADPDRYFFDDPDRVNALIEVVEAEGGVVLYFEPGREFPAFAFVDLPAGFGSLARPARPGHPRFTLNLSSSVTSHDVRHELFHVRDVVLDPAPELAWLNAYVANARTRRDRLRNLSLRHRVTSLLELRAISDGNAGLNTNEFSASDRRYYAENLARLKFGEALLNPGPRAFTSVVNQGARAFGARINEVIADELPIVHRLSTRHGTSALCGLALTGAAALGYFTLGLVR